MAFAREGGVPCCWLLRGRRKSRGGERCVRVVRVCVGLWGGLDYGGEKKKTGKAVCRKTGQKSLFCANFELSLCQPL